jgi:hypothetical protein
MPAVLSSLVTQVVPSSAAPVVQVVLKAHSSLSGLRNEAMYHA